MGNKPVDSPSLSDDPEEFRNTADQLWGSSLTARYAQEFGSGKVYAGMTPNEALAAINSAEDFQYTKPEPDTRLMFVHRKLDDGDLYFVDNRTDRAESLDATFRVVGKAPELWDAATGTSQPVSYEIAGGRTTIPLHLDPWGTVFVVFRTPTSATIQQLPEPHETSLSDLDDALNHNWTLSFEQGKGAPETAKFDQLASWSDSSDVGIKYFSGTATYSNNLLVPASALPSGARVWLDLGDVKDVAEVAVNGKYLGILWKAPYRVDVTDALKAGSNQFVIQVTNLWVNRLIGDQQPYALKKYTFTTFTPYKAESPLLPSGLLGPLHLTSVSTAAQP